MKKIDLPLENWVNLFAFLSRQQLAALVPHIGDERKQTKNRPIADRQFVSFIQFYLHECGDVTLGHFFIKLSPNGPVFVNKAGQELLLVNVPPMPSKIRSFKHITINYYDQSVHDFLQKFRRMFINVNLRFADDDNHPGLKHPWLLSQNHPWLRSELMTKLSPLITSVESIENMHLNALYFKKEIFDNLKSARVLINCDFGYEDWYRRWLRTPRDDGKPRVLLPPHNHRIVPNSSRPISTFINNIIQDFLGATHAVSFFAYIMLPLFEIDADAADVHPQFLDNNITQERLSLEIVHNFFVTISRFPMEATQEWIEEMQNTRNEHHFEEKDRKIEVDLKIDDPEYVNISHLSIYVS